MAEMVNLPSENLDPSELGAIMREMRLAMPRELSEVAAELRIREIYLEAIEAGRLDDLPGPAYATGFLRAYGDYLGLNGADIVSRFKESGVVTDQHTNLHLPSPVEEGRLPTGSVLMLAGVLALVAYGGWYYLSSDSADPVEMVSALPDQIAGVVDAGGGEMTGDGEAAAEQTEPDAETQAGDPAEVASEPETEKKPEPPAAKPAPPPPSPPAAKVAKTAPSPSAPPPPPKPTERRAKPPAPATPEKKVAAAPATAPAATPNVPPPTASRPRIVLRANADSWVEVRKGAASPVYSGLMRSGETFEVPEQNGFTLYTGNAGAIEVRVNGRVAPPLGPMGKVRRDIALDPDALMRTRAAPE